MPKSSDTHSVLTANRTDDGSVVYMAVDRRWTPDLQESCRVQPDDRDEALAWAQTQEREVCDPYYIEVTATADGLRPLSARERIRAEGPLVTLTRLGYGPSHDEASAVTRAHG